VVTSSQKLQKKSIRAHCRSQTFDPKNQGAATSALESMATEIGYF